MIKAVCFDLDGVYFTSQGFSKFKEELTNLGAKPEKINYFLHKEPMEKFKKGEVGAAEYWKEAIEYLQIPLSPHEIINLLPKHYEINPQVKEYADSLRQKGYKTCICSNNFTTRIEKLQEKFNFLKDFDFAVFSYEIGVLKPDKEIFEELIKRAALDAKEIAYSDDSEEKLSGALALGINAFLYEGFEKFKTKLENLGVDTR